LGTQQQRIKTMRLMLAKVLFFFARPLQKRGIMLGQWLQNKGILLLANTKMNRRDK